MEEADISTTTGKATRLLTDYGFVAASGADAGAFLHAQLSADIEALRPEETVLTGWHDPKGRVLCCVRVTRKSDSFWLAMPRSMVAGTLAGLRRYVLRARVELTDASDRLAAAGLLDDDGNRYEIHARADLLNERVARHLDQGVRELGAPEWQLGDIRAGLPQVVPETSGLFTGQMLNLDRIGGISFAKGCYPGQEIIARTHHLGRIKRRMQRYVSAEAPRRAGEPLTAADGRRAGQVVRSAPAATGSESLVVTAADKPETLYGEDGSRHEPATLPYSLSG